MDTMIDLLHNDWVIYVGAFVIAAFGIYTLFLKTRRAAEVSEYERISPRTTDAPSRITVCLRGFLLNFFNPVVWFYWCTMVTLLICGDSEISLGQRYLFFGGVLMATLGMDILKCKLASLLQRLITYRFLKLFNKSIGVIMIASAIIMVVNTLPRFEHEDSQRPVQVMQDVMNNKPPTILRDCL